MKITKKQLRRIISELHPRDVADAEYDSLLQDLGGMYSDMHKELYGRRPRGPMFKTVEEAEAAVEGIWAEYAAFNRAREEQEKQDLEFLEMERRMQELMPGEYDIELPMQSGMGRRVEGVMKITKRQLRSIIKEEKAKLTEAEGSSLPPEWDGTRTLEDQEFDELFGHFIELGIPADSEFLNHPDLDGRRLGAILDIWEGRRMP